MKRVLTTLLAIILSALAIAQENAGHGYLIERGLPYHQDAGEYAAERCVLDFYYPADIKGFPTVVWFHGGGLEGGQKEIPAGLKDSGPIK